MYLEEGLIVNGVIESITNFGAFVDIGGGHTGMVHISEIADQYVRDIHDIYKVGDEVMVKILEMKENGKISLSIKKARPAKSDSLSFEDMLTKFKESSMERMLDIKRNYESKRGSCVKKR